ncbi:MAG: thioredoxin-dependent thiol peroxidase [Candidatus Sericytochromatia bacterium]
MQHPPLGSPAPAFSLRDQDGQTVSLADFHGTHNVVLYFYPKALTPGCTTQACGIRDSQAEFAARDTVVLGVSPDAPARLRKFADKENLNFTLLSDPDHAVAESYGVWGLKKFMGREYDGIHRISFVIDKAGQLVHVMPKVKTASHHADLLAWLDAAYSSKL